MWMGHNLALGPGDTNAPPGLGPNGASMRCAQLPTVDGRRYAYGPCEPPRYPTRSGACWVARAGGPRKAFRKQAISNWFRTSLGKVVMEMGRVLEAAHDLLDEVRRASKTNSEMAGSLMRVILAIWPKGSQIAEADLNADIPEKIAAMRRALENVRALAARLHKTDPTNAEHLLRFCRDGGVEGSVVRTEED